MSKRDDILIGTATRVIYGADVVSTGSRIQPGTEVKVRETSYGKWVISAHGVRTLPMTFDQMTARVEPC